MSHWYDWKPIKKKLDQIQKWVPAFSFTHHGECLSVYDIRGEKIISCKTLEEGMNFVRIVKSVLEAV